MSLIEVLEELTVGFPDDSKASNDSLLVIPLTASLVTAWVRESLNLAERTLGRFQLLGPSDQKLAEGQFNIDLESHRRMRCFANTNVLSVQGTGTYHFVIEYQSDSGQWVEVDRLPIDVRYEGEQKQP